MKICKKCNIYKDLLDFSINRNVKEGYSSICKICYNDLARKKRLYIREVKIKMGEIRVKLCSNCKIEKRISKFNKSKKTTDGYLENCIECNRNLKKSTITECILSKRCTKCGIEKNVGLFYKSKKIKDGYFNNCIDCEKKRSIEYHHSYRKKSVNKNRNFNKDLSKLKRRIRSSLSNIIKDRGFRKKCKTEDILGCSIIELKIYLESRFESWMSWDNHGIYNGEFNYGWDIDHIIPVSLANDESELINLNHYTNLQPLCSKINRDIKKNKVYEKKD